MAKRPPQTGDESGIEHILHRLNGSDPGAACSSLNALINAINAQSGGKIEETVAGALIDQVNDVKAEIGCG